VVTNSVLLKTQGKKKKKKKEKKSCSSAALCGNMKLDVAKRRQYDMVVSTMEGWDCCAFLEMGNEKISC